MKKAKRSQLQINDPAGTTIIKHLEKVTTVGRRPDDVFEDWLMLVEATLAQRPRHEEALLTTGQLADDPPEVAALFAKLRERYPAWAWEHFSLALAQLILTAEKHAYEDTLGQIYMAWGYPRSALGQYFTPGSVARMMAAMIIPDGAQEVHRRIQAAIAHSPSAQALLLAGTILEGDHALAWLIARVIPACIEHYEPVRIQDPCIGSGVMMLAAAAQFPSWIVQLGLVQFYGQDLDPTCVRMAHINIMVYGLNGHGQRQVLRWAEAVLTTALQGHADEQVDPQPGTEEHQEHAPLELLEPSQEPANVLILEERARRPRAATRSRRWVEEAHS